MSFPLPMTEEEYQSQSAAAKRRGDHALKTEPLATAVKYDHRTRSVIVSLNKGHTLSVPVKLLEIVATAAREDLQQVEILGPGTAIEWPTLDQQFSVMGLLKGIFGFPPWMKTLTKPGEPVAALSRNTTKNAAAARANGAKGGRPKKKPAAKS